MAAFDAVDWFLAILDMLLVSFVLDRLLVGLVNCEKKDGRRRTARGLRDEREAQIIAVPTSITLQLRDLTAWSVGVVSLWHDREVAYTYTKYHSRSNSSIE